MPCYSTTRTGRRRLSVAASLASLMLPLTLAASAQDSTRDPAQALREAADAIIAERDALQARLQDLQARPLRHIRQTLTLRSGDVLENVTLKWVGPRGTPTDFLIMVKVASTDPANPAIIRNVTFDTAHHQQDKNGIRGVDFNGANGLLVENVKFLADDAGPAVENAFITEGTARNITVRNFEIEGTQAYGFWFAGADGMTIEDGYVGPSVHEHGMRGGGWKNLAIRRVKAVNHKKSPLWLPEGEHAIIEDCDFAGEVRIGPLDKGRHGPDADIRTRDVTVRNTTFRDRLVVKHGCVNVTFHDGQYGGVLLEANDVAEFAHLYDKPATEIHFAGHTQIVIDSHAPGEGLVVQGRVGPWSVEHLDVRLEGEALTDWIPTGWNDYAFRVPAGGLESIEKLTLPPAPIGRKGAWPKGAIGIVGEEPVTIGQVQELKADAVTVHVADKPTTQRTEELK